MIFTISSQRTATAIRLCVAGELDVSTVGQLDRAIDEALRSRPGSLLVDLAGTTFCDCAAITALLAGQSNAIARDVAYQVVNPTGISLRILQIFQLDSVLTTRVP